VVSLSSEYILTGRALAVAALLSAILAIAPGFSAHASDSNSVNVALSAGLDYYRGHLRYEIGNFDAGESPISRLTWPVKTVMFSGKASVSSPLLEGRLQIGRNLGKGSGVIEDVDYEEFPNREMIRSESQSHLILWNADVDLLRRILPQHGDAAWSVWGGAGYTYRDMRWEATDLHQWTPSSPDMPDMHVAGLVATYEANLNMPYVELVARYVRAAWLIEGHVTYSPYLFIDDADDHVLRGIRSDAFMNGQGLTWDIQGQWHVTGPWFLTAMAGGLDLHADGDRHSRQQYGTDNSQITWSMDQRTWISEFHAQAGILCLLP
jgi:outer membrane protease